MTAQIVEIAGQKMAMLPIADYQRLLDLAEDKADLVAAMQAEQRRRDDEEYLPVAMADRILAGESALKVWRNHRGMTLAELGKIAGVGQSHPVTDRKWQPARHALAMAQAGSGVERLCR